MEILMIKGSPHSRGTSALLAQRFEEGAAQAGHSVAVFEAAREEVHPCQGCDYCTKHGEKCVQKDAMQRLYPQLLSAELVVLVTPLYYYGMSAQLKKVVDRFYAVNQTLLDNPKKAVLLATSGDADDWTMQALKAHYEALCRYLGWQDAGALYAEGVYTREEIEKTDYPGRAFALGKGL
ncbi:flavodoxin family protein [Ruminococcaceae bacterium OttesenSCG-928-I18]|nr:flavodoxin family protein [Ruminococcaceae bacterium OttesenSCG-928-I18]